EQAALLGATGPHELLHHREVQLRLLLGVAGLPLREGLQPEGGPGGMADYAPRVTRPFLEQERLDVRSIGLKVEFGRRLQGKHQKQDEPHSGDSLECPVMKAKIAAIALALPVALQAATVRIVQTNSAGDSVMLIDPVSNAVVAQIDGIEVNHG